MKQNRVAYLGNVAAVILLIGIIMFMVSSCQSPDEGENGTVSMDAGISAEEEMTSESSGDLTEETAAAFATYFKTSFEGADEINEDWFIWFQGHDADHDGVPDMFVYSTGSPERYYVAAYSDGSIIDTEVHPQAASTISVYWLENGIGFISDEAFSADSGVTNYRVIKYLLSGNGFQTEVLAEAHYKEFSGDDTTEIDQYWADRETILESVGIISEEERDREPFEQAASYDEFAGLMSKYGIDLN